MKKLIVPVEPTRTIRLASHRFGQVGNMFVIEDDNGDRIDLYLTDEQVTSLMVACTGRLKANAASRAFARQMGAA